VYKAKTAEFLGGRKKNIYLPVIYVLKNLNNIGKESYLRLAWEPSVDQGSQRLRAPCSKSRV